MGLPRLSTYPRGRRQGNPAKPTVVHLLVDTRNALGLVSPRRRREFNLRRPGCPGLSALDPWLCVPAFQRVCLFVVTRQWRRFILYRT